MIEGTPETSPYKKKLGDFQRKFCPNAKEENIGKVSKCYCSLEFCLSINYDFFQNNFIDKEIIQMNGYIQRMLEKYENA